MSIITIPADDINEFLSAKGTIEFQSFSWNEYSGPEAEFYVSSDFEFETGETYYTEIEVQELEDTIESLQELNDELTSETEKLKLELIELKQLNEELKSKSFFAKLFGK